MEIDPWAFCKGNHDFTVSELGSQRGSSNGTSRAGLQFSRLMALEAKVIEARPGGQAEDQAAGQRTGQAHTEVSSEPGRVLSCQLLECRVRGWVGSPQRVGVFLPLGECCLRIEGKVALKVVCHACHNSILLDLPFARTLVLKPTESQADAIDADLPEDADAISCGSVLNLQDAIEDEIFLSMPMYPRHEVCPDGAEAQAQTHRPFAALGALAGLLPTQSK